LTGKEGDAPVASFNGHRFAHAPLKHSTETVEVPCLRPWFDNLPEDQQPVLHIRGLSYEELTRADIAAERGQETLGRVIAILSEGKGDELEATLRNLIGVGKDAPAKYVKRLQYMTMGCEEMNEEAAMKFSVHFSIEFGEITNKILALTGRGSETGK